MRARYAYDPYGHRTKLSGDVDADFGFAGMFFSPEVNLSLTHFRAYDPELGRWLSRDPLPAAEISEGPNLFAYVINDPVNLTDPLGLISSLNSCFQSPAAFATCVSAGIITAREKGRQAVDFVGQGIQRVGSAIGNCFNRAPSAPTPPSALEVEIAALEAELPAAQRQFESIAQRLPEARRQWQDFYYSIRANADWPKTDRFLEVYGRAVPGSPQIIVDLETELDLLRQVAPNLHGILARNFNFLGMGSRWSSY